MGCLVEHSNQIGSILPLMNSGVVHFSEHRGMNQLGGVFGRTQQSDRLYIALNELKCCALFRTRRDEPVGWGVW